MAEISIPSSHSEITPAWIQTVTGHCVKSDSLKIEGGVGIGFGFLSSISRVSYRTEDGKDQSIIVKLLPTDPKWLEFALSDSSDERELLFYKVVLPELLEVAPSLQENLCLFYNGAIRPADPTKNLPRASLLVLDDLKVQGYKMMDHSGDGSPHVLHSLMDFLARFHYAAHTISLKKGKSLAELYPFVQGVSNNEPFYAQMEVMSEYGYGILEKLLKDHNVPDSVWKRYQKLKPFSRKIIEKVAEKGGEIPCLIHSDLWPANCMIHESGPVKVLDWQIMAYRDATFDLAITLYTTLPTDLFTRETITGLLRRYWEKFEELCESGEWGKMIKRRTWEDFEEFFFTWGTAFSYVYFLPGIECFEKDYPKYVNVLRVICEEYGLPEFLLGICNNS